MRDELAPNRCQTWCFGHRGFRHQCTHKPTHDGGTKCGIHCAAAEEHRKAKMRVRSDKACAEIRASIERGTRRERAMLDLARAVAFHKIAKADPKATEVGAMSDAHDWLVTAAEEVVNAFDKTSDA